MLLRRLRAELADLGFALHPPRPPARTVIYTAVTNHYDVIRPPLVVHPAYDYVAFVDTSVSDVPPPWQPRPITIIGRNPRITSRYYKLHPHRLFPGHAASIWVDASLLIKTDLQPIIDLLSTRRPLALHRHPARACIYEEAEFILQQGVDDRDRVTTQIMRYRQAGYPPDNGLYANGVLARLHHHPRVRRAMRDWWIELQAYSQRDQLSAPVIFARHRLRCVIIPGNLYNSDHFEYHAHRVIATYT